MVLPASHRVSRAPWYSGLALEYFDLSSTGLSPSMVRLPRRIRLDLRVSLLNYPQPQTPKHLVWPLSRSLAAT